MNQRRIFLKKSFTAVAAALIAPSVLKANSSGKAEMAESLPIGTGCIKKLGNGWRRFRSIEKLKRKGGSYENI